MFFSATSAASTSRPSGRLYGEHLTGVGTTTRQLDARGNTTADVLASGTFGYGYNGRNRLTVVQNNGVTVGSYVLNALGQRVQKTAGSVTTSFDYDEASRLLSENTGAATRDYVWMDNLPLGIVDGAGAAATASFIHADGLGSARAVTSSTGVVLWQWAYASNPFGENAPTSSAGYVLNLRFPGQYFDAESGLSYNVNRDYEASTGRYVQSDPIGLSGGISTYLYAGAQPLTFIDMLGLDFFGKCLAQKYLDQYGQDAWSHARQDRTDNLGPVYPGTPAEALRNAEHYLYANQEQPSQVAGSDSLGVAYSALLSAGYAGYKIARNLQTTSPYQDDWPSQNEIKAGIEGTQDAQNGQSASSDCGCGN